MRLVKSVVVHPLVIGPRQAAGRFRAIAFRVGMNAAKHITPEKKRTVEVTPVQSG